MNESVHKDIIELLPAYALGSLDAEEAERVEQHLASCAACRAELAAYEELTASLPLAGPLIAPSGELNQRLMREVGQESAEQAPAAETTLPWWQRLGQALRSMPRWQPVAFVLILALIISNVLLWQRARRSPDLPAQPIVLTNTEAAPQAQGTLLVSGNGRDATLIVEGLPPLSPDRQYQLWLIQDGQRDNGGVFSVNPNGYSSLTINAPQPLQEYSAFGVTIEPAGGSPGPTGPRVLGHNL